jgi:hypothetical protein
MNVNLKTALEKTEHFSNLKLFNWSEKYLKITH